MKPNKRFLDQEPRFWANVRSISQSYGYTARGTSSVRAIPLEAMVGAMDKLGLAATHLVNDGGEPTPLAVALVDYFSYRADVLNTIVPSLLMNAKEAERRFRRLKRRAPADLQFAMNKQTGTKAKPSYFTAIIKMLVTEAVGEAGCSFDPQKLTTFTDHLQPIRTLARRVDGAFPSPVNPIALWEIKEYYYTTTFGSRIADGVYESLLDGVELDEMRRAENIDCLHYLMVDGVGTWWSSGGRPYLCRIIDMMHMGLLDEALFGREVETRIPELAKLWLRRLAARDKS